MKKLGIRKLQAALVLASGLFWLTSCGTVDSQASYTSSAPREGGDSLATPPGLSSPDLTSDYKMTAPTSYKVSQARGMYLTGGGAQRWLVIESQTVSSIWPSLMAYMNQMGLTIKYQNPAIGVIQSDWATRNNNVPQGFGLRGLFDWIGVGSMYSLKSMYMYRVTLWQNQQQVIVMVTDYQMDEEYRGCSSPGITNTSSLASSDQQQTKWIPRPSNPQLELEFLAQYMVFAGMPESQAKTQVAAKLNATPPANAIVNGQLVVNDQFDRAWWRTALALERVGLGVADKNRSSGEYYVYPLKDQIETPDPGFFSKLFGSNESGLHMPTPVYTVTLKASGEQTLISIQPYTAKNNAATVVNQGQKYLTDLATQLQQ